MSHVQLLHGWTILTLQTVLKYTILTFLIHYYCSILIATNVLNIAPLLVILKNAIPGSFSIDHSLLIKYQLTLEGNCFI